MFVQVRIAPSNALIFISDSAKFWATDIVDATLIVANDKCISVGRLMWQDGETNVMMAPTADFRARTMAPDFDGVIDTPSGTVMVSTVEHDVILTHAVAAPRTRVRIWVNCPREPDEILIGQG